jgi:hypothetical protein
LRTVSSLRTLRVVALIVVSAACIDASAQANPDSEVLKGFAPLSTLSKSDRGKAALTSNYEVTGGIERGEIHQATLLPFSLQEEQSLQDAFTTGANLAQLSDGLGSTLGAAYTARFHYIDQQHTSAMPEALSNLIRYASGITGAHSTLGKYFFGNGTLNGKATVPPDMAAILSSTGVETDPFGRAYSLPAGSPGAGKFGDSRPFQTERSFHKFEGIDYFNHSADNTVYNSGPSMNLVDSPSFPSGHTTYGYTGAVLLAVLVPERYSQMIARGAEYGNDRILMGSHYAMDVLGGRTLALYDLAHLLANDPSYMGKAVKGAPPITDFQAAVKQARETLVQILEAGCGDKIAQCASQDTGRFNHPPANEAFYKETQTYGLAVVYPDSEKPEDVSKLAPEAGFLLTQAYPALTLKQADDILTATEGPGGGFLDSGSAFGVYSRIDLYAASQRVASAAAVSH